MLPCWLGRDTIRDTIPAIFKEQYPILDAAEIKINTPSSLLLQSQTYSNYKSTKGMSTRMRFKMCIQSESSKFAFNSNRAHPHATCIAISLLTTLRSI